MTMTGKYKNEEGRETDINLVRVEMMCKMVKPGQKVLDIGSKWYPLKKHLPKDIEYHCLDIEPGENIVQCDLNHDKIPFEDNYFDVVLMGEVIEHLANLDNALSEISRVGKKLIGSTPNGICLRRILREIFYGYKKSGHFPGHFITFTHHELNSLLKNYYDNVNINTYFLVLKRINIYKGIFRFGGTLFFICEKVMENELDILD